MNLRRIVAVVVGVFLAVLASSNALASPLYLVQENGATQNDRLLKYDLGVLSVVGNIGFGDVRGLAYNASTNTMFGVSRIADRLISIDLATGAGTLVGAGPYLPAGSNTAEISVDSAGNMYGLGHNSSVCCLDTLHTVNQTTGVASAVGGFAPTLFGLAFQHATGTLYGTSSTGALYTLNTTSGAATFVGNITGANGGVGRIAFDQNTNTLFGISFNNQLVTIDLGTLAATAVDQFSGNQIYSLDFVSGSSALPVPEPGAFVLLGTGILVLFGRGSLRGRRTR